MSQRQRRLAAIMFTDLVGYTALGQRDEELSIALVEEHRKLVRPVLARHNGKEVKTIGDAFLVEFPNALDGVRCAYDIQRTVREFNLTLAPDRRMHLRIGLHVGEVVWSQGDISGDAVNVASRIEPLAEDGGVCITRQVYDHVQNKFEIPFVSLGAKPLKNVEQPLEVFRMAMPWDASEREVPVKLEPKRLAVLPFSSMSPDPADSYFADGITEEIISTVSGVSGLAVISRTSVMGYKGTTKKLKEIGRELEAGTVLEGSFRKAGDRIRVTAQLIDVNSDSHVWAESYDRQLHDIFEVQTDIAKRIADALKVRILPAEKARLERAPTKSTEAYALYLRGRQHWNERTEASMRTGIRRFEQALELDPDFALAFAGIADCYIVLVAHGYMAKSEGYPRAMESLARALAIDPELGEAHAAKGTLLHADWKWAEAAEAFRRCIQLAPNYATGHHWYSQLLASQGRWEEAIAEIKKAQELDPNSLQIQSVLGIWVHYSGDVDGAIEIQKKVLAADPDFLPALSNIFSPYVSKGMIDEARKIIQEYVRLLGVPQPLWGAYAGAYVMAGEKEKGRELLGRIEALPAGAHVMSTDAALAYFRLGDRSNALRWFKKAVGAKDNALLQLMVDPANAGVARDPEFVDVLRQAGFPGIPG